MLWVKAFHVIAMVAWFAGLFYLPRLFVYHTDAADKISLERFKVMERRLYYGITWPAALITTVLGIWLLSFMLPYYQKAVWMHVKLGLVFCCGGIICCAGILFGSLSRTITPGQVFFIVCLMNYQLFF